MSRHALLPGVVAILLIRGGTSLGVAEDDELSTRVARIDAGFVKALGELAARYDQAKDPEAAHFLASCAIGLGSKDPKVAAIKAGWELDLFVGKVRGGEETKDVNPIDTALRTSAIAYNKVYDELVTRARRGKLTEGEKRILHEGGVKYEIAQGAHRYIPAVQRFNALRRAMGLRALLWDFEESRKLIRAAWYISDTADIHYENVQKDALSYSEEAESGRQAARCGGPLKEHPDYIRSYALLREQLLNPNARRLWLAHWHEWKRVQVTLYTIPQLPCREDIPTPSQRHDGRTVDRDWVDTEDTIEIPGKRVPYVRYPYANEPDAPWCFSNGRGAQEAYWADSETDFLSRAGVPLMLRFFVEGALTDGVVELKDKSGRSWAGRMYLNGDKRVVSLDHQWATILFVPEKHLDRSAEYTIRMQGKAKGTPFEMAWRFTTRAK